MSFFDNSSDEREEENLTVRELLTEMKDISEVIVDLAYAALLFDSDEIGDEVKHLESKMDVLNYEIRSRTMLASRTKDDAIQLSGLLQIAESAAAISKAAGDIVGIREINPQNSPFLSFVLRDAEEKILPITINKKSDMCGKEIDELSVEAETGMRIIAIKRDIRWIYDPEGSVRLKENDMLIVRGTEDGFNRLRKFTRGEEKWPTYPTD